VRCANGYLMESLMRWADKRGQSLVIHGIEISPHLATLARTRLPGMAKRIHTGNAIDWCPPQRFDLVAGGTGE